MIAPSSRQLLLEAMLCVFAWLASNVVSTLATIFNRHTRDWHTDAASEDQLRTSNDTTKKGHRSHAQGTHARSPAAPTFWERVQGTRVPGAGRDPASAQRLLLMRKLSPVIPDARGAREPEPRGDAHRHYDVQILGSRFCGNDSVGARMNLA